MARRAVLWDFDGTLAWREGLWGSALIEALDELEPGHGVKREHLRPHLRSGFPWHEPQRPHPELCEPQVWWRHIEGLLVGAFQAVGFPMGRSTQLARAAHEAFIDPTTYRLYADAVPAIERLSGAGYTQVILSNHVPELESIVEGLGIRAQFRAVITSAVMGYEKPHTAAFRAAIEVAGHPETLWMVGDNPIADVAGAQQCGIPAILVHSEGPAERIATGLEHAADIILSMDRS